MDENKFDELAATVYDRQIRLWGHDAQRRLSTTRIALGGVLDTLALEIGKNLALAGVGGIILAGTTETDGLETHSGNYIKAQTDCLMEKGNTTRVQALGEYLQNLNPAVEIECHNLEVGLAGDNNAIDLFSDADYIIICDPNLKDLSLMRSRFVNVKGKVIVTFSYGLCAVAAFDYFESENGILRKLSAFDLILHGHLTGNQLKRATSSALLRSALHRFAYVLTEARLQMLEGDGELSQGKTTKVAAESMATLGITEFPSCNDSTLNFNKAHTNFHDVVSSVSGGSTRGFLPVCSVIAGFVAQEVVRAVRNASAGSTGQKVPLKKPNSVNNVAFFTATELTGRIYKLELQ